MWTMISRWKWFLAGALLGALVLVVWFRSLGAPEMFADLVDRFPQATQARPRQEAFTLADVTIAGRTLKSISVSEASRLIWQEGVPPHAWLDVTLGVREDAWTKPGDGVLFMVGVTANGKYDELVSLVVNPSGNPADRQWYPLLLDLSPYAGQKVEIIFNTRAGAGAATPDNDFAVWGAPAIVTR